ncbi:LADA_0F00364g1_1 [Lachancea dasiensis]|uniref:LADA_0F00364g1_1 n=1 Tax=Lachancea dasiensis TaxID=1072105 RepID=A0A1G4JHK3_9SACH|nr:LADA_0F00364g1_1 [Lachancea dasiensis]
MPTPGVLVMPALGPRPRPRPRPSATWALVAIASSRGHLPHVWAGDPPAVIEGHVGARGPGDRTRAEGIAAARASTLEYISRWGAHQRARPGCALARPTSTMPPAPTPAAPSSSATPEWDLERNGRVRQQRRALLALQLVFCVVVPAVVVAWCGGWWPGAHGSSPTVGRDGPPSQPAWRLDTARNYSIDTAYWHAQRGGQERHYYFNISTLAEVAPDGVVRNLTVVNGQYPGPLIQAAAGDTLVIHVETGDVATALHCHGLFFNRNNSFLDGASGINQCAVPAASSFEYAIQLDEAQSGTYWYHSHYGSQQADGVFGPLVVHSARERALVGDRYDADLVVMVNDYYHDAAHRYLAEYLAPDNENSEPTPDGGLVQGANAFEYDSASYVVPNGHANATFVGGALAALELDPAQRYRVRVVNAGFFAPFNFAVDGHRLTVVEADGTVTEPLTVESIDVSVSQRYSFVLERADAQASEYWMRVRFNRFCFAEANPNFDTDVAAIVRYDPRSQRLPTSRSWDYNGGDVRCRDFDQTRLRTLGAQVPLVQNGSTLPDVLIELDVSFLIKGYQLDRGYFNDVTYTPIPGSSTMYELLRSPHGNSIKTLDDTRLETTNAGQYLINLDQRGAVVDLVVNNYDDGAHPFHLHGHKFWVLASADRGYFHKSYYENGEGKMDFSNPIARDVLGVSGYGYAVIRFVVDSPGIWPFHCHIGWHMESGLLLQINELQSEYSAWTNVPSAWEQLCEAAATTSGS